MLVLTRRVDQRVIIGGSVELHVLGINGRSVKLGFTAPPEIAVDREELRQRIAGADWNRGVAAEEHSS